MEVRNEATIISKDSYKNKQFNIVKENQTKKVNMEITFSINENNIGINKKFENTENDYKNWASISSNLSANQIELMLNDYKSRTKLIDTIIDNIIQNNINGIVIDFKESQEKESMLRFIIEITPKLREIGVTTGLVLNENVEKDDYINIVDYIIE